MRRTVMTAAIVLCALLSTATPASAGNWTIQYTLEPKTVRQEQSLSLEVTLTNDAAYQMKLTSLGIHFDWMEENVYYFNPGPSDTPIMIASGANTTVAMTISITKDDVPVGSHNYYFYVAYELQDGLFGGWNEYSGKSKTFYDLTVQERDRDNDGVGDSDDAFPDDPSETKDTDLDGVGDNRDAFPNDPKKWKADDSDDSPGLGGPVVMLGLLICTMILARRNKK